MLFVSPLEKAVASYEISFLFGVFWKDFLVPSNVNGSINQWLFNLLSQAITDGCIPHYFMFANLSQFILIKKYFKTWEIWMLELIGKFSVHWPGPRKNTEQNFYTVAKARSQLYTLNT